MPTQEEIIAKYPTHHRVWRSMVANNHSSHITPDWRGYNGFLTFIEDMNTPPSEHAKIKRMDTAHPYSKDNCYWATPVSLSRNVRFQKSTDAMKQSLTAISFAALAKKYPTLEDATCAMEALLEKQLSGDELTWQESTEMDYLAEYITSLEEGEQP